VVQQFSCDIQLDSRLNLCSISTSNELISSIAAYGLGNCSFTTHICCLLSAFNVIPAAVLLLVLFMTRMQSDLSYVTVVSFLCSLLLLLCCSSSYSPLSSTSPSPSSFLSSFLYAEALPNFPLIKTKSSHASTSPLTRSDLWAILLFFGFLLLFCLATSVWQLNVCRQRYGSRKREMEQNPPLLSRKEKERERERKRADAKTNTIDGITNSNGTNGIIAAISETIQV